MKAVIGSLNESKINGARRALSLLGISFKDIIAIKVKGFKDQPIGFDEIFIGAAYRAIQSVKYLRYISGVENGIGIGIEAGIIELHNTWFSGQIAVVADNEKYSIGISSFFPLPRRISNVVSKGYELREVMKEISGYERIAETIGAIGFFSSGYMTRTDLSYQAVLTALLPWINKDIYELRPVSELWETLKRAKIID
ncbi:MAG: DUF84 family protein [Staphylothermus sp.]|nr:DUF84 family protein [Staphylothermus sp.]